MWTPRGPLFRESLETADCTRQLRLWARGTRMPCSCQPASELDVDSSARLLLRDGSPFVPWWPDRAEDTPWYSRNLSSVSKAEKPKRPGVLWQGLTCVSPLVQGVGVALKPPQVLMCKWPSRIPQRAGPGRWRGAKPGTVCVLCPRQLTPLCLVPGC